VSKNLRLGVALLAGMLVALVVVMVLEGAGQRLFPWPSDLSPLDTISLAGRLGEIPMGSFLMVLSGHLLGTGLGAWTAVRLAPPAMDGGRTVGMVMALIMQGGAATMLALIPHPVWFAFADIVGIGALAWAGTALAARRKAGRNPADGRKVEAA